MELKAKTPKGAAKEIKRYLIEKFSNGCAENAMAYEREIIIRSPKESRIYGGPACWTLIFEGGPFEWAIAINAGGDMFKWAHGQYSAVGDFPKGLTNEHVFVECQNHYQLCFTKNG